MARVLVAALALAGCGRIDDSPQDVATETPDPTLQSSEQPLRGPCREGYHIVGICNDNVRINWCVKNDGCATYGFSNSNWEGRCPAPTRCRTKRSRYQDSPCYDPAWDHYAYCEYPL